MKTIQLLNVLETYNCEGWAHICQRGFCNPSCMFLVSGKCILVDCGVNYNWHDIYYHDWKNKEHLSLSDLEPFKITNKNEIMKRQLELSLEQAQKLYNEQPSMRELLLTTFTKEELEGVVLKDWSELRGIAGYYVSEVSAIKAYTTERISSYNKNVFATEKQAKSALAMAQLSQLMKDLGSECEVDWSDGTRKQCIVRINNRLEISTYEGSYHFLAFKTAKVRDAFATKHERLIRDYFMLD